MERMERAGNGASGKRCDIDGVTRTGELAGVSESSRDIEHVAMGNRAGRRQRSLGSWREHEAVRVIMGKPERARERERKSQWDERHGRLRREVTVERGGSWRDTMELMGSAT
jgi:hypothetical protein